MKARRVAQGFAGTVVVMALLGVPWIRHQNREFEKMMSELHHRLELIQAETRGRMEASAEFRRAANRPWSDRVLDKMAGIKR